MDIHFEPPPMWIFIFVVIEGPLLSVSADPHQQALRAHLAVVRRKGGRAGYHAIGVQQLLHVQSAEFCNLQ